MSYAIVYSSNTGNTALLAGALKDALPKDACVYCGGSSQWAADAELVFAGFWTDKGDCDGTSAAFLEGLRGKRVFLFGTAGFGGGEEYFGRILSQVRAHLDCSNAVVGSYMCQGKMPVAVRKRYEAMKAQSPEQAKALLANFDRALSHPGEADLEGLKRAAAPFVLS